MMAKASSNALLQGLGVDSLLNHTRATFVVPTATKMLPSRETGAAGYFRAGCKSEPGVEKAGAMGYSPVRQPRQKLSRERPVDSTRLSLLR